MNNRIINIKNNNLIFFLNIFIFICILKFISLDDSEPDNILTRKKLSSIVRYSLNDNIGSAYNTLSTTPEGNLICSASFYQSSTMKYYYGLKSNGRPYFIKNNIETEFTTTDSDKERNEGIIYGIKLGGSSDDKEYIIAIGNNEANVELYDFSNDEAIVYTKPGTTFFSSEYNSFKYGTIFKLKSGTDNYYILTLILQLSGNVKYFHIMKLYFTSPNIANYDPIILRQNAQSIALAFSSCFENDDNIIICFFIDNQQKYIIAAYDYQLNLLNPYFSVYIASTTYEENIFYKCIHFSQNIGAFIYFNSENKLCFQFKKYESSNFNSPFTTFSSMEFYNPFSNNVKKCDAIRLENKKFCYITISNNNEEIHLFIFNNFVDEKFSIRHYNVETKLYNNFTIGLEMKATLYNDYIGLVTGGSIDGGTSYSYLIIFSYPNSADFDLDITDILKSSKNPIINFNEKCKIENNIFGYQQVGIKLVDFSDGLKLLNEDDKSEIQKGTIFNKSVELIIDENIDLTTKLRIEYQLVAKDPPYSLFKDYSELINTYCPDPCNEENYYTEKEHIGRLSYCNIIVDSNQISNNCGENCNFCKKDTQECVFCEELYWVDSSDNKKCTNIKIPTTIITTIPTTITTTIPSTIITTIPTTITTTIPTTIITTISTTFITTIHTTIFSYISTDIIQQTADNMNDDNNKGKNCTLEEIINNNCKDGKININQIEEIKNNLLNENYHGENTIIATESVIIQLSTLEDQMNSDKANISNIDLGECEDLLRANYSIPAEEDLIIYKTDIKTEDSSSTYVVYEVYDSHLNKLELSICSESQVTINVPVHLDDTLESLAKSLDNSGYNLFNEKDSFYNDICATYTSKSGTDMLLSDRKTDIYASTQNQIMCQTGCELESYNITSKKAKCNCDIQITTTISTLKIDNLFKKKEVAKSFYDTLANSNFQVMKCYKLILDFSKIFKNYGEIFMTVLILIFLVLMIIYFIVGKNQIHSILVDILKLNWKNNGDNRRNKRDKYNEEGIIANSEDKKIISKDNQNRKRKKRFKFVAKKAPPKKKKITVQFQLDNIYSKNHKNSKMVTSTHNLKQNKSEINDKKIKVEKMRYHLNKNTNIRETEDNNKIILDENEFKMKNLNDTELDDLEYQLAIIYDKRTFFQFYWSQLKQNHLIIFAFVPNNDYNLIYVKIALFIISFGLFFTINGFFFSDDTMHKVYEDNGKFDIIYQIPQIFYSSIISSIANILLRNLSLSESNILKLKTESASNINNAKKKARQIENCLKIKLIIFFILSFLLMLFFWYFISCFCAVYKNTQIILIKDTLISFLSSMLYPFILCLIPGCFRIPALRAKSKDMKCLYKFSSLVNWIL